MSIFEAAVSAVHPARLLPQYIKLEEGVLHVKGLSFPLCNYNNLYVVGAGKASAAMACEIEKILLEHLKEGVVVTKYGHTLPLKIIHCIEAGHPLPDENSIHGARQVLDLVKKAEDKDIIIILISGGASSLLADHPSLISLLEQQNLIQLLMAHGADIEEINTVRKHVSCMKGGQLVRAAFPATVVTFILSDVIGDFLHVIGSGLTVPDPTTFEDAIGVLQKYNLQNKVSPSILQWITKGRKGEVMDTPKVHEVLFERCFNFLIGSNHIALKAAAAQAHLLGYTPFVLSNHLQGEASTEAIKFIQYIIQSYKGSRPACILMGGETTVTIKGDGKGGRSQEFTLAALVELMNTGIDTARIPIILAGGTDGTDGPTDVAGAIIDGNTIHTVSQLDIDPSLYLQRNDAYHFFQKVDGHITTGATQTNVMDIVIALLS